MPKATRFIAATQLFALAPTNANPQGIADPPNVVLSRREGQTLPQAPTSVATHHHDSALLAITGELSSLLSPKKRK